MSVSVVVETVTAREDSTGSLTDDLQGTLDGLARQSVAPDEILIVIDDNVDNATADALRRCYPQAKLVSAGAQNYFAAKNAGAAAASGDIVALLDGDCMPAPDWLEMLLARFEPGVDGVCGRTRYTGGSLVARTLSVPDFAHVVEQDSDGAASGMNINNVAFRRDVLLRHPFDARIRRNGGCYFLFNQLRAAGRRVVYEPGARTSHGYSGTFTVLKKHFDRGRDGVDVYRLDEQCVLRGTRLVRRLGPLALVGLTGRRVVADWIRMARKRRQIGIAAIALPYYCAVAAGTRMIELAGGFVGLATRMEA